MRDFAQDIQMMNSKARPKKITAFAVSAGTPATASFISSKRRDRGLQPGDVGEMHFLVKQEAKGDLRKDARVQERFSDSNDVKTPLDEDELAWPAPPSRRKTSA